MSEENEKENIDINSPLGLNEELTTDSDIRLKPEDGTNETVDTKEELVGLVVSSAALVTNGDSDSVPKNVLIRRSRSWSHAPINNNNNHTENLDVPDASGSQSPSELSLSLSKPLSANLGCEMCSNYETRLQQLQVQLIFAIFCFVVFFYFACNVAFLIALKTVERTKTIESFIEVFY